MQQRARFRRLRREQQLEQRLLRRHSEDISHRQEQLVNSYCQRRYGFVADPTLPPLRNLELMLRNKPLGELGNRPRNLTCHILGSAAALVSPALSRLLGLGLNYCITTGRLRRSSINTNRFVRDTRTRFWFAGNDNGNYNPRLYIPNPDWKPSVAIPTIEMALRQFNERMSAFVEQCRELPVRQNLTDGEREMLTELRDNPSLLVVATDKNLGPAVIDTQTYIDRCLKDHLLDEKTYQLLTEDQFHNKKQEAFDAVLELTVRNNDLFPEGSAEYTFFMRALGLRTAADKTVPDSLRDSLFHMLPKVHKQPVWKTRPIVSGVGSITEPLSKWLDDKLQQVVHLCPSYLKDNWALLDDLKQLGRIPTNARFVTVDAVSMYSNINTNHGLETLDNWLDLHAADLPKGFPKQAVMRGLEIVMRNNLFRFGNTNWLQLNGTAMGTPVAVMYATIYYSYHEEVEGLRSNNNALGLLFYRRYIDDAIALLLCDSHHRYDSFVKRMNDFGEEGKRLVWEATTPSRTVDFLDLTLQIEDNGSITTKTYQKKMNLYLYLPPTSAHPPGVFASLIYGFLWRLRRQNTYDDDYKHFVQFFFCRLLARGHQEQALRAAFTRAAARLDRGPPSRSTTVTGTRAFLHIKYHVSTPSRADIQKAYQDFCKVPFQKATNPQGSSMNLEGLTIAYSRPTNIGELARQTRLRQTPGTDILVSNRISELQGQCADDNTV